MPKTGRLIVDIGIKGAEDIATVLHALELMGVALAGHNHQWTTEERHTWEKAVRILGAATKK